MNRNVVGLDIAKQVFHLFTMQVRIPVNVATQTAGKLPPKPVKVATLGGVVGA